jgi:hypothetical protein
MKYIQNRMEHAKNHFIWNTARQKNTISQKCGIIKASWITDGTNGCRAPNTTSASRNLLEPVLNQVLAKHKFVKNAMTQAKDPK